MSDKPVYQMTIKSSGFFSQIPITTENERERDKWKAAGHEVRTLYPASAYEALQKENNSLKLGYKAKESILQEAQKEVAKLRSFDADNKGLKECNSILTVENEALKAENEALRKQVAELANETAKDHVKIMHLKDALSAYGDPDVFVDDED